MVLRLFAPPFCLEYAHEYKQNRVPMLFLWGYFENQSPTEPFANGNLFCTRPVGDLTTALTYTLKMMQFKHMELKSNIFAHSGGVQKLCG